MTEDLRNSTLPNNTPLREKQQTKEDLKIKKRVVKYSATKSSENLGSTI